MVTTMAKLGELGEVKVRTERVSRLRQEWLDAKPHILSDKARIITESWKETEGEPPDIRWAKVFKKLMEELPVFINAGEIIVGSHGRYSRSAQPDPSWSPEEIFQNLEQEHLTTSGEVELAQITDEDRETLLECAHYWKGRALSDVARREFQRVFGDEWAEIEKKVVGAGIFRLIVRSCNQFADFDKLISSGLVSVVEEARARKRQLTFTAPEDYRKSLFYEAVIMCGEALATCALRHAELARSLARKEADVVRKRELEKIAEVCEWVPWHGARSFREALQSFWFIDMSQGGGIMPGRMDQYFYPYYEKDIREGKITPQEAAELLGCLILKTTSNESMWGMVMKQYAQAGRFDEINVGGVTKDGKDATNDMTFLILEAARQMKLPQPFCLRYHRGTSDEVLVKAVETSMEVSGQPAFLGDDAGISMLMRQGIPLEEARDWCGAGCIYTFVARGASEGLYGIEINPVKGLEFTLNNGVDPVTGIKGGLDTGDPTTFASFEEFYAALKRQYDFVIDRHVKGMLVYAQVKADNFREPARSMLLAGCLESGKDVSLGGELYPVFGSRMAISRGLANVVDSVAAIKKLMFEQKKVTMAEMLEALRADWKGYEKLRQMCLDAPKYGNDDDYADDIMRDLAAHLGSEVSSHKNPWGYPIRPTWQGGSGYYYFGKYTGATPDGRRAGELIADAPLSPATGRDIKGPTAVFNSAIKADHPKHAAATILNMKVSPLMLKRKEGMQKFLTLLRTYFDRGGYHVQINMVSKETLLDAKAHPEKYRDLIVRVAGYSAFWVDLSPDVQDQIIARVEQPV